MQQEEEGQQQQQQQAQSELQVFLNQILTPVKLIKNFCRLFIVGDDPASALANDLFFLERKQGHDYECFQFQQFYLVICPFYNPVPKKSLIDKPPYYSFKSIAKEHANSFHKYGDQEKFIQNYLCQKLQAVRLDQGEFKILHLSRKKIKLEEKDQQLQISQEKFAQEQQQLDEKEKVRSKIIEDLNAQLKIMQEQQILKDQQSKMALEQFKQEINTTICSARDQAAVRSAEKDRKINQIEYQMRINSDEKNQKLKTLEESSSLKDSQIWQLQQQMQQRNQEISSLKQQVAQKSDEKNRQIEEFKQEMEAKLKEELDLKQIEIDNCQNKCELLFEEMEQLSGKLEGEIEKFQKAPYQTNVESSQCKAMIQKLNKLQKIVNTFMKGQHRSAKKQQDNQQLHRQYIAYESTAKKLNF